MTTASPTVAQAPRLTTEQISRFKRDGFLVLPGVVDPELCRQARDQMWDTIADYRPSMRRDDPSTWTPISDEERAGLCARRDRRRPLLRRRGSPVLHPQRRR